MVRKVFEESGYTLKTQRWTFSDYLVGFSQSSLLINFFSKCNISSVLRRLERNCKTREAQTGAIQKWDIEWSQLAGFQQYFNVLCGQKVMYTCNQWRFYMRGRWGIAPPEPDDAVVQKAQCIRTSRQNIYICIFLCKVSWICMWINLTHKHYSLVLEFGVLCVFLSGCSVKCCSPLPLLTLPHRYHGNTNEREPHRPKLTLSGGAL